MKKIIRIEVKRTQDTFIYVEFDDRDYKADDGQIMDLVRDRVENKRYWEDCSYEFGMSPPRAVKDTDGHDSEHMPRPQGWRLKRLQSALGDWKKVAELELVDDRYLHTTVMIELAPYRSTRRLDLNEYVDAFEGTLLCENATQFAIALQNTFSIPFTPSLEEAFGWANKEVPRGVQR